MIELLLPARLPHGSCRGGFTLIELMVVVGITAVIGAIAIPNLLEMRMFGREAAAASALKSQIMPAMHKYQASYQQDEAMTTWGVFPAHVASLAGGDQASVYSTPTGRLSGVRNRLIPETFNNHDGAAGTNTGCYFIAPGATEGQFVNQGAVVDGYCYSVVINTDRTEHGMRSRQMFVTVIATPTSSLQGRRAFGFSVNPHHYDCVWSPATGSVSATDLMLDAVDHPDKGMFKRPAGYPEGDTSMLWWGPNHQVGTAIDSR